MRKEFAIISGAIIVWAFSSAVAFAFEQSPLAPAPADTVKASEESAPEFDSKTKKLETQKKTSGLKIPGIGKLSVPKFNFGLDLMYGTPENDDSVLSFSGDSSSDNDLTILGKVKRRF